MRGLVRTWARRRDEGHPCCTNPSALLSRNATSFGIPSTSRWTGAAIIVRYRRTKSCIVIRSRTSPRPALLFGRVTYEMMEAAWRPPAQTGARPDWMEPWMEPFARTIDAAKKVRRVEHPGRGRLERGAPARESGEGRSELKRESGKGLFVAGVKLPLALTELGLIDEYELVVQPRLAGHGPTLFAGLSKHVD
jgi:dihydrofolate reductase